MEINGTWSLREEDQGATLATDQYQVAERDTSNNPIR